MGTDIHAIIEIRVSQDTDEFAQVNIEPIGCPRDYHTFAIMADVRNGQGFAGTQTGNKWPSIHEPRGLPTTITVTDGEVRTEFGKYWLGDHSHSWLTLSEMKKHADFLDKYNDGRYLRVGVVERQAYLDYIDKAIVPSSWSGFVSGQKLLTVASEEFDRNNLQITHVRMSWSTPWKRAAWSFPLYIEQLDLLRRVKNIGDNDIRLVFGFSS